MNPELLTKIEEWATKLGGLLEQKSPEVWKMATGIKQADSIGKLLSWGIISLFSLIILVASSFAVDHNVNSFIASHCVDGTSQVERYDPDFHQVVMEGVAASKGANICQNREDAHFNYIYLAPIVFFGILGIIAFCMLLTYGGLLLQPWTWISAYHPDLGVGRDIMDKVMGSK